MENCLESASMRCQGFSTSQKQAYGKGTEGSSQDGSEQVSVIPRFTWLPVKTLVVLRAQVCMENS